MIWEKRAPPSSCASAQKVYEQKWDPHPATYRSQQTDGRNKLRSCRDFEGIPNSDDGN